MDDDETVYEQEPQLAKLTFETKTPDGGPPARSPTPKADWGISDGEKVLPEIVEIAHPETPTPPNQGNDNIRRIQPVTQTTQLQRTVETGKGKPIERGKPSERERPSDNDERHHRRAYMRKRQSSHRGERKQDRRRPIERRSRPNRRYQENRHPSWWAKQEVAPIEVDIRQKEKEVDHLR